MDWIYLIYSLGLLLLSIGWVLQSKINRLNQKAIVALY